MKDKICPIMSRYFVLGTTTSLRNFVYCQKEKCMAWGRWVESVGDNETYGQGFVGCKLIKRG